MHLNKANFYYTHVTLGETHTNKEWSRQVFLHYEDPNWILEIDNNVYRISEKRAAEYINEATLYGTVATGPLDEYLERLAKKRGEQ